MTIHIRPGLPVHLETLDAKLTEAGLTLLGINKPELETFISSGQQITNLLRRLDQYGEPWQESTNERVNIIQTSIDLVTDLNEIARQGSFLQKLFQYDEDILGVYLYPPRGYDGVIELYWGIIWSYSTAFRLQHTCLDRFNTDPRVSPCLHSLRCRY